MEGEIFHTLLFQTTDGLERLDLCEEAWQTRRHEDPQPDFFWKSTFKPTPPPPPEPLKREDAESELRRMLESGEPTLHKACALLALLLERKRVFKLRERTQIHGQPTLVYEHTGTQETFLIPDLKIHLNEVALLQEELTHSNIPIFAVADQAMVESTQPPAAG